MESFRDESAAPDMEQASSPDDVLFQRAMEFERQAKYRDALELLTQLHERSPEDVRVVQRLARNTYRDEDQLPAKRFAQALELLRSIGLDEFRPTLATAAETASRVETLGLAGAIYKRMWEISGQLEPLQRSLDYYRRGWELAPGPEGAWCGINTVFALEALASRERHVFARDRSVDAARGSTPELARIEGDLERLRAALKAALDDFLARTPDKADHWSYLTLAEVEFGLGNYARTRELLVRGMRAASAARDGATLTPAQIQVTFKQFVRIARLKGVATPEPDDEKDSENDPRWAPWRSLEPLLADTPDAPVDRRELAAALNCARGRVGLALSGGGFRASLFHIGVLARLADVDALRSVEALSTVSGGSIVGALYYLEVKRLLESKPDFDITREDYVAIVARVQERFLSGVQQNLRTRVISNWFATAKMLLPFVGYTRSARIGELYERHLYSRVGPDAKPLGDLRMRALLIEPRDARAGSGASGFNLKEDNWRRNARVPMLLLNATSLNSGHSWQFTARTMGEPPGLVDEEIGANPRHRRLWYEQAPLHKRFPWSKPSAHLREISLGQAVAASACVPGLFEPLELRGLYPGRFVRLVDGGVYDNLGLRTLVDQGFSLILCSDASGQMNEEPRPGAGALAVPLRSFGIITSRVREAEYASLHAAVENRALQGACFVHLRKDLDAPALDWIDCDNPSKPLKHPHCTTGYGIDKGVQRQLSAVRTDLDSFGEVESFALMVSGYRMIERELQTLDARRRKEGRPGQWGDFDIHAPRGKWTFLDAALERVMSLPDGSGDLRRAELGRQLAAGASSVGKLWLVAPTLAKASAAVAGLGALASVIWLWEHLDTRTPEINFGSYSYGAITLWVALALFSLAIPLARWLRPTKAGQALLLKVLFATVGWLVANFHVWVVDPLYLRLTRLERFKRLE